MESKKNELEPTEIAQHLKGNAKVGGDFLYISPEAYRRISRAEFMLAYGHLVRVVESALKGRPAQEPRLKTLIAWNDLLPSPGLRKQTAKMVADQQAHITGLQAKGRHTVRSVSFGVIGSALAQALLTAIGLAVAGVPAVGALSFLTFLVAVIQLPTLLVWAPAAFWLYSTGEIGWAIALGIYGLAIINTSDNLLRPLIISQSARLPLILIFLGVIGGLLAWGFLGLFIGPTLLAMTYTLFLGWIEASPMPAASDVPAPGPAPPAPLA